MSKTTTLSVVESSREERALGTRAVTLAEVAERAGVSKMTASSVLNPSSRSQTRVSEATRGRILEAAATLRYTPNHVARSLRRQKTDVFAFCNAQNVAFKPTQPFYAAILEGVQRGCTDHGKDLLIHAKSVGHFDDIVESLHNGQIDGLVLHVGLVLHIRALAPLVQRLVESHLPIVTLGEGVEDLPHVAVDEERGGQLLAEHLADKGYKRVLYRSWREQAPLASWLARKHSFCQNAQRLGLTVSHSTEGSPTNWPTEEEQSLLLSSQRPEVVVCWNDMSADGIAEFCRQNNIRIPQDLALAGFDGLVSDSRPSLRFTTIQAPWKQVARTAVELLARRCNGEEVPKRTILPVELFEGETT